MNKTLRKCAVICLGVLGVSVGKVWYENNERKVATANRNALIESAVFEINKSAPRMVDEATRLDSAQYSAGKLSTFYTLPNTSLADIDKDKLFTIGRNAAKSNVCSKKIPVELLKSGVIYEYVYRDSLGRLITRIWVDQSDC